MAVRRQGSTAARPQAAPVNTHPLTFNQIKNKPGLYEHRNGNILIVSSSDNKMVRDSQVRTGYTRTGMLMFDVKKNRLRKVVCDHGRDGVAQWRNFTGVLPLQNDAAA